MTVPELTTSPTSTPVDTSYFNEGDTTQGEALDKFEGLVDSKPTSGSEEELERMTADQLGDKPAPADASIRANELAKKRRDELLSIAGSGNNSNWRVLDADGQVDGNLSGNKRYVQITRGGAFGNRPLITEFGTDSSEVSAIRQQVEDLYTQQHSPTPPPAAVSAPTPASAPAPAPAPVGSSIASAGAPAASPPSAAPASTTGTAPTGEPAGGAPPAASSPADDTAPTPADATPPAGTPAKVSTKPTEPGFYTERSPLLQAWDGTGDAPKYSDATSWGGVKDQVYSADDQVIARTKGMSGLEDEQQRAALYSDVTAKKGATGQAPLSELARVQKQYTDSQDTSIQRTHRPSNPYAEDYKVTDARARYESRLTGLSAEDKQKGMERFDKAVAEKEKELARPMTDEEQMAFVNQFGHLKGEDLAKSVKGGVAGSGQRGSEKLSEEALERFGETYKTDPEREALTNGVNDYLKETFDDKIAEEEAKLKDDKKDDAEKTEAEATIAKLWGDREAAWQQINDNLGNPKKLAKILGKDKDGNEYFHPSKAQIRSARKESPNLEGSTYGQVTRTAKEIGEQFNFLKGLYEGGKGIVDGVIAIGEKPLAGLKEVQARVDKDNTTVSAMANSREIDPEKMKYEKKEKGKAGEELDESGVSAGVSPTAEAGNMLASRDSISMANPSPNGKKRSKRTDDLEELADQASLNRRLQRATV